MMLRRRGPYRALGNVGVLRQVNDHALAADPRRNAIDQGCQLIIVVNVGVEIALLIDVATHLGPGVLAQVDLGERIHRNRPLHELRPQAVDVLRAALERVPPTALPPLP